MCVHSVNLGSSNYLYCDYINMNVPYSSCFSCSCLDTGTPSQTESQVELTLFDD